MKADRTKLPGVMLIEPDVFGDDRGFFLESWSARRYAEFGVDETFVQDNLSKSARGVLRGLHLQHPFGQGKLVQVIDGEVFDVAVDVRRGSPTFGQWVGAILSGTNHRQIYIPPGFAHGFYVTSETAVFAYKCTEAYHHETELGVIWNDPDVAIDWPPDGEPTLSKKDAAFPKLADVDPSTLPDFRE